MYADVAGYEIAWTTADGEERRRLLAEARDVAPHCGLGCWRRLLLGGLGCEAMNTGTALRHTRIGDPVLF